MTRANQRRLHLFVRQARFGEKAPALSFELRPQVHAIVARTEEQGEDFVRSAAGMTQPKRGRILLGESEPYRAPELRARIGSLLRREPPLTHPGTVREYLADILALRHKAAGSSGAPPELQTVPYVAELLDRRCDTLDSRERRHVALGLALTVFEPLLLVLSDPLFDLDAAVTASLLERLGTYAENGAIVACVVPTERAARQLSERIHHLEPSLSRDPEIQFLIRSQRPRDVASSLSRSQNILSTQIRPSGDLIVSATSEESAAADITGALASAQVEVFEVRRVASPEVQNGP